MARPNKPNWFAPRQCWRSRVNGKVHYFPRTIGKVHQPMMDGIPRAAWDYLHQLQRAEASKTVTTAELTVEHLAEAYLAWCEAEAGAGRLSPGQYSGHRSQLARVCGHVGASGRLGAVRVDRLDVEALEGLWDALRAEGLSRHYVSNIGKSVRAMLNWGVRPVKGRNPARLLDVNPLRDYRYPRAPGAVRGYVEGAVIRRFLRWAWARSRRQPGLLRRFDRLYVLMLRFQRLTGCRPGEACALEWGHIDWSKSLITLEEHKTEHVTHRARKIHVTRPVARLLRAIERLPGRHERFVFTHRRVNGAIDRGQGSAVAGEPWADGSSASQKVRDWRLEAIAEGLEGVEGVGPKKLVAYSNRHAYASEAVSAGLSIEHTAELLGNTPAVAARVYVDSITDAAGARAEGLAEARRKLGRK